jgi:hypothetical protein
MNRFQNQVHREGAKIAKGYEVVIQSCLHAEVQRFGTQA